MSNVKLARDRHDATLTFRLKIEYFKLLNVESKKQGRSKGNLLNQIIKEWSKKHEMV